MAGVVPVTSSCRAHPGPWLGHSVPAAAGAWARWLVANLRPAADREFIEERRRALKRFLNLVARHPPLCEDVLLKLFLSFSGPVSACPRTPGSPGPHTRAQPLPRPRGAGLQECGVPGGSCLLKGLLVGWTR